MDEQRSFASTGDDGGNDPTKPARMETLREALARLERRGFVEAFRPTPDGELALAGQAPVAPETLVVEETVRFEGESDPEDMAVLFALRTPDGHLRGTFVASYGASMDPASAEVMHRLPPELPRDGGS
jgi:hypothetical protein